MIIDVKKRVLWRDSIQGRVLLWVSEYRAFLVILGLLCVMLVVS